LTITKLTPYQLQKLRNEKKIHAAHARRKQYKGMTDEQITFFTPLAKAELLQNKQTGSISLVVKQCPICGDKHTHGYGDLKGGYRVPHCMNESREVIPYNYDLNIDWRNPENVRLRNEIVKRQVHKSNKQ
jgi:hypothetical protein